MKKTTLQALQNIEAATTPQVAKKLAITFFQSAAALDVRGGDAVNFINRMQIVFRKLQAPNHYEAVLHSMLDQQAQTSYHLQEAGYRALRDFEVVAQRVLELQPHLETRIRVFENMSALNATQDQSPLSPKL